jgi:hypothetical protein
MASSKKRSGRKASSNPNGPKQRTRVRKPPAAVATDISAEDVKRLPKAPGDYAGIAQQFADALERTKFRGDITAHKIRTRLRRGQRLLQRAAKAQDAATAADRQRIVHDSQLWKSIMATWRLVVAALPAHPDLETPFAFMREYMSTSSRSAPPATPPA